MQECLQIDLPPHADPYGHPRPVGMYPSMPLSPPGQCAAPCCQSQSARRRDAVVTPSCFLQAAAPWCLQL